MTSTHAWIARNAQRLYLIYGFIAIAMTAIGIYNGVYIASIPLGVLGGHLLGGWPALRRLVRHPKMQLTHWWHILRDTRRVEIREYPDGSNRVSIMRPTRRNGWSWREERGDE